MPDPLFNQSRIDVGTYRISTLSPVHIGGGDVSKEYGQSFFQKRGDNDYIYLLDTPKFQQYLFKNHGGLTAVEKFADWIEGDQNKKSGITAFLNNIKFNFNDSNEIIKGKVHAQMKDRGPARFIRDGRKRAYIPGSSIKGVIRTAVLWKILKEMRHKDPSKFDSKMLAFIEKQYLKYQEHKDPHKFKERFSEGLVDQLFRGFMLKSPRMAENHKFEPNSPFTDLFKVVKIKDSTPIKEEALKKRRWDVLSLKGDVLTPYMKFPRNDFMLEAYRTADENQNVDFEVLVDLDLLENFRKSKKEKEFWSDYTIPFNNVDELMGIVFDFSQAIWSELEKYYSTWLSDQWAGSIYRFYNNGPPDTVMRIGWGTGLLGTTMALILKENPGVMLIKTGEIVRFDPIGQFGAIKCNGEDTLFFLSSVVTQDRNNIEKGSKVTFDKEVANGLVTATNICISGSGTPQGRRILEQLRDDVIHGTPTRYGIHAPKSAKVICNKNQPPEAPFGWIKLEKV